MFKKSLRKRKYVQPDVQKIIFIAVSLGNLGNYKTFLGYISIYIYIYC